MFSTSSSVQPKRSKIGNASLRIRPIRPALVSKSFEPCLHGGEVFHVDLSDDLLVETHCLIKSIKPSKVEAGKKADLSVHVNANYYRHEIDGRTVTEIDVFNKITIIGGNDKSANARRILGFTY